MFLNYYYFLLRREIFLKIEEKVLSIAESPSPHSFNVGTLVYSRAGLITLFGWLLWGDFVFTIMNWVIPSLLPVLLKNHGATNKQIAFLSSGLFMLVNATLNPIISYRSDRYRSRWGRRRPFILWTTPFVVLFMAAVPFGPEILHFISRSSIISGLLEYSPILPLILMIGLLVTCFQIFNVFVASVYYYLIPDVVPQPLLGRFFGLFRLFASLGAVVFNYYIYGLADRHMHEIFVAIAVFYGVMITLMCVRVKEGEYPPPPENHGHWWAGVKTYACECFGSGYFWWVFLAYACVNWCNLANPFMVFFFCNELGFTLDSFGKLMAAGQIASAVLIYPMGILLDRWGSHITFICGQLIVVVACVLAFFGIRNIGTAWVLTILFWSCISLPSLAAAKWTVDVYPRDRYGQFGSAGAMFSSLGAVLLSLLCGLILDWLKIYRIFFLWVCAFNLLGAVVAFIVYKRQSTNSSIDSAQRNR